MKGVTSEEDINKYLEFVSDRPLNDFRYPLDNSKMQALGWEPRTNWEEGLQKTSKCMAETNSWAPFSVYDNPQDLYLK